MKGDDFLAMVAQRPPFTRLHPKVAAFFKTYLAHEKVVSFGDRYVANMNFPPYPGPAFEAMTEEFSRIGETNRLYSVTLAVTNRCEHQCWHCYNAGRCQTDTPLPTLAGLARELQDRGAVMVTLTGGEPLLREDLEEIARQFDPRSCLVLGTTGDGLTAARARRLRRAGIFAVGISLDSQDETEHDRLRGRPGAFRTALAALRHARENGLYAYVVSVATRDFLQRARFLSFMRFVAAAGALEVHLLEPSATGKLAGQTEVLLTAAERRLIFSYQHEVAQEDRLPILSSFSYLESAEAFGCGAGLTHLYIDGSGEVCPCNLVPLSFGNIGRESLGAILGRMGCHFQRPRTGCVGRQLARHFPVAGLPAPCEVSARICEQHLPKTHALPGFFRIREAAQSEVGQKELRTAYNSVHQNYDEFWLSEAAKPIDDLIGRLRWSGHERVFEAGCGTGYASAQLAARAGEVLAADVSRGMISEARARLKKLGLANVRFTVGDALAALLHGPAFHVIFSSWVLGYIPLKPFFAAASNALARNGRLAFIVHRENSPREPLEIFAQLVAENPAVLRKKVAFDFPRDLAQARSVVEASGLAVEQIWPGSIVFHYDSAAQVLEHLLKSGAGTAFYQAITPGKRNSLTKKFLERLEAKHLHGAGFDVRHEYIGCIARKG